MRRMCCHCIERRQDHVPVAVDVTAVLVAHGNEIQAWEARLMRQLTPMVDKIRRTGQVVRGENDEYRLTVDQLIPRILERAPRPIKMGRLVLAAGVFLFDQRGAGAAMPNTRPGLVGPGE